LYRRLLGGLLAPRGSRRAAYAERVQRHGLGLLFTALATALGAVGVVALLGAGGDARRFVVALAALAVASWLASLALSAFRRR